mmetsp:Transcript_109436/g.288644  ORF Transcript_109436/g.288644 Transcript_109436/m.288644 type:complete len:468 (-) Transcript_109436:25-1428(-)
MEQPEVVSQLVDRHHDLEVVGERLAAVAHGALLPHVGHALGARRPHLWGDHVDKIVAVEAVAADRALHGLLRRVVEPGEGEVRRGVPVPVAGVPDHLGHDRDVDAELSVRHLPEVLVYSREDLVPVVGDRVRLLLRVRRERLVTLLPVHDHDEHPLRAPGPPLGRGELCGLGDECLDVWVLLLVELAQGRRVPLRDRQVAGDLRGELLAEGVRLPLGAELQAGGPHEHLEHVRAQCLPRGVHGGGNARRRRGVQHRGRQVVAPVVAEEASHGHLLLRRPGGHDPVRDHLHQPDGAGEVGVHFDGQRGAPAAPRGVVPDGAWSLQRRHVLLPAAVGQVDVHAVLQHVDGVFDLERLRIIVDDHALAQVVPRLLHQLVEVPREEPVVVRPAVPRHGVRGLLAQLDVLHRVRYVVDVHEGRGFRIRHGVQAARQAGARPERLHLPEPVGACAERGGHPPHEDLHCAEKGC